MNGGRAALGYEHHTVNQDMWIHAQAHMLSMLRRPEEQRANMATEGQPHRKFDVILCPSLSGTNGWPTNINMAHLDI